MLGAVRVVLLGTYALFSLVACCAVFLADVTMLVATMSVTLGLSLFCYCAREATRTTARRSAFFGRMLALLLWCDATLALFFVWLAPSAAVRLIAALLALVTLVRFYCERAVVSAPQLDSLSAV